MSNQPTIKEHYKSDFKRTCRFLMDGTEGCDEVWAQLVKATNCSHSAPKRKVRKRKKRHSDAL